MPTALDQQWDSWIARQMAAARVTKAQAWDRLRNPPAEGTEEYKQDKILTPILEAVADMVRATDAAPVFEPHEQQLKDFALLQTALQGKKGVDQQAIALTGLAWVTTLLRKNADYGGSAWQTPALAPDMQTADAILVRMSDKIARLAQLRTRSAEVTSESFMDTMGDLGAYALLYVAYVKKQQLCEDACEGCGELGGVEEKVCNGASYSPKDDCEAHCGCRGREEAGSACEERQRTARCKLHAGERAVRDVGSQVDLATPR